MQSLLASALDNTTQVYLLFKKLVTKLLKMSLKVIVNNVFSYQELLKYTKLYLHVEADTIELVEIIRQKECYIGQLSSSF